MARRSPEDPAPGRKRPKPRELAAEGKGGGRRRSVLEPEVDALQGQEEVPVAEELTAGRAAPSVPAEPPAPAVGEHGVVSGDVGLPPLDELSALLAEAEDVQRQFSLTKQEVAGAVAKYDDLQTKRGLVDRVREHLVGRSARMGTEFSSESQRLNDPNAWTADDLQQFVAEGILTEQYAVSFGLFNQRIDSLSADEQFANNQRGRDILAKLRLAREEIVRGIKNKLDVKHQKTGARIQRMHDSAEEHHTARVARLEAEMGTIRENPLVAERLEKREKERVAAEAAARQAAELARRQAEQRARQVAEKQQRERLGSLEDPLYSLEQRFEEALKRLQSIVGHEVDVPALMAALAQKKKEDRVKPFEPLRKALIDAVNVSGKNRLETPKEVAPWMMRSSHSYGSALRYLQDKEAKSTLAALEEAKRKQLQLRIDRVQSLATMFNYLLNGDGPRESSPFFKAFDDRRQGVGAASGSAESAGKGPEKEKIAFAREVKEVLDAGGFAVEQSTSQGLVNGAVLVERTEGKKVRKGVRTPIYRITRIVGLLQGIKVGDASTIDSSHNSFPPWFRIAVDKHFAEMAKREQAAASAAAATASEPTAEASPLQQSASEASPAAEAAVVPEAGAPTPAEAAASAEAPAAEAAPGGVEGDSVAP